ncbi:hypothetical protein [Candidatus Methylomirabilis sp.]|uniref:hypothetical protein n=1 Tax=Candidatus Methylomirabilis sp. TaxID=2032687 RepID=UPI002A5E3D3D|nr:hypothetical protein [Candidatus Methylomirabilis sp.]
MRHEVVIPKGLDEKRIREWAEQQNFAGVPLGLICELLLGLDPEIYTTNERISASRAEGSLFGAMVERNILGKQLEARKLTPEAIRMYEQNVSDWFIGDFPYRRLRVIYARGGRQDLALRVYQSRAESLRTFSAMGKSGQWERAISEAEAWIAKLAVAGERRQDHL